ncbi:MAG: hypothetical protein ABS944_17365 [Solibacillus sp.]|uniref:hypothetical protein n=1 Tax=Solibacillus sp. TaxID=1909654 RepID=UPI0033164692
MFKSKISKFIFAFFSAVVLFNISTNISHADEVLTTEQKEQLRGLGFPEEIVSSMTIEEYEKYSDIKAIEPAVVETTFYKISTDEYGDVVNLTPYNSSEATSQMRYEKYLISPLAGGCDQPTFCNSTTSWLSMTTSATSVGTDKYLLSNSFVWLNPPNIGLQDMVGITYNSGFSMINNTTEFAYKYDEAGIRKTQGATQIQPTAVGVAALFDFRKIGAGLKNHHGYITTRVTKANKTQLNANAYGHYTHTTIAINPTISIRTGDISLGVTTAEKKMPNTLLYITF